MSRSTLFTVAVASIIGNWLGIWVCGFWDGPGLTFMRGGDVVISAMTVALSLAFLDRGAGR